MTWNKALVALLAALGAALSAGLIPSPWNAVVGALVAVLGGGATYMVPNAKPAVVVAGKGD